MNWLSGRKEVNKRRGRERLWSSLTKSEDLTWKLKRQTGVTSGLKVRAVYETMGIVVRHVSRFPAKLDHIKTLHKVTIYHKLPSCYHLVIISYYINSLLCYKLATIWHRSTPNRQKSCSLNLPKKTFFLGQNLSSD